ncbi:NAD(P)H-dependent oxidoreductase [Desulfosudis oleivorans]|uniref:Low molecular weight phosphotyrosine protein phosphatase n=1 Tax=Desulfosudis oleivorans (strain DSM 6200 / JCM 39069 / Hxd3) TaxID=96561 RepID=A8ZTA9_DESOH|nr:NAD(P)H-dependent oxidoreductase [Desulfosudis oleivorans]ABW67792.1 low molecular weight phosphotyrosine protein phosphatase [Desulfosudis oleivorans Hxd3]
MFALGLMGSPRKKGNSAYLLSAFLKALEAKGAVTHTVVVAEKEVLPCIGCTYCEKHGRCFQQTDDMAKEMYGLFRRADIVVAATPMYFYSAPAQLKMVIDRTQTLWSRNYRLNLRDPRAGSRAGFMLSLGATKGKNLFEGINLTARYFFDAVSAEFTGWLGYRRIENPGDMEKQEGLAADIAAEVSKLDALFARKKMVFVGTDNTCTSRMAEAFAMAMAGDRVEAMSAGMSPAEKIDPEMEAAMAEKGVDMAFGRPRLMDDVLSEIKPGIVVTVGIVPDFTPVPGAQVVAWEIPNIEDRSPEGVRRLRDDIEARVAALIQG